MNRFYILSKNDKKRMKNWDNCIFLNRTYAEICKMRKIAFIQWIGSSGSWISSIKSSFHIFCTEMNPTCVFQLEISTWIYILLYYHSLLLSLFDCFEFLLMNLCFFFTTSIFITPIDIMSFNLGDLLWLNSILYGHFKCRWNL